VTSLSVDLESRSLLDLRNTGVYPYASHPSTDVWCMAYAFDDEDVQVWTPGQPLSERLVYHVNSGWALRAHNAAFERIMWRDLLCPRYDFPPIRLDQWYCTAAEAAAMSLPRHLGQLCSVLNVAEMKDDDGHRLMLQMCRPRSNKDGKVIWWDVPEKVDRLIGYCAQDVRAERACAKRIRRLGTKERVVYLLDQTINDRGVLIDVPLVKASAKLTKQALADANEEVARLTGGDVDAVTKVADLKKWLNAQGVDVNNVRKGTVRDLLEDEAWDLDQKVRDVLTLRQDAGKSSTAKLKTMLEVRCEDDRARGLTLYHGASTGRWTGKLIQPHNFPRPTIKDVEDLIPRVYQQLFPRVTGEASRDLGHPSMVVVSNLLRSMLRAADGCTFMSGDYSQIEARVLGWIAGEPYGDKEYEKMAASIYKVPLEDVTSEQRHVGKGVILGAGYQMGWEKFKDKILEDTGVVLTEEMAREAIRMFRAKKSGIPEFWRQIECAAVVAVQHPGETHYCGPSKATIKLAVRGAFLWIILPSGRPLAYALPRIAERETKYGVKVGLQYMGMNSMTHKWEVRHAYGGLLTENVVQAMARDLLAESMLRLEEWGYPVVLSVHDEIVCEVPEGHGSLEEFLHTMRIRPRWAGNCPVEVDGWEGMRYRK